MLGIIPAEKFNHWLQPAAALELLPTRWETKLKAQAILQRLASGSIRSAARKMVPDFGAPATYVIIPAQAWQSFTEGALSSTLWVSGDLDARHLPSFGYVDPGLYEDVRFDPGGLAELNSTEPSRSCQTGAGGAGNDLVSESLKAPSPKPLPAAKMREVCLDLDAHYGERLRRQDVEYFTRGRFPEHVVSRDQLREIMSDLWGPAKRGPKRSRGE